MANPKIASSQIHRGHNGMIIQTRVQILGPLLTCYVTTGKLHELSEPQLPQMGLILLTLRDYEK